jgi:hypothetical protein
MTLESLKTIFKSQGCKKIYIKLLSPNDNSKNQVYLAGSFELLNIFPISTIEAVSPGEWKNERFKASLNFYWLNSNGNITKAPKNKLILYPKYPEVRFSGFLTGCENAPSDLMNGRIANRTLFFGIGSGGRIIGFVSSPTSTISQQIQSSELPTVFGVLRVIELTIDSSQVTLFNELRRIHEKDWIPSKKLTRTGAISPCNSSNCGGYTLEAELGITPNGFSEPDFLGWEVKQFAVKNFKSISNSVITLMTPEPTGGKYVEIGVENFVRRYGYLDKVGREDRMNFGGIHKVNQNNELTNLRLELVGFDASENKIISSAGYIGLLDRNDNIAASWNFSSLLLHWNRKHNQACYVPSESIKEPTRCYRYSNEIIIGTGTDFQLFLGEMYKGNIYYDPGIKLENYSTNPKTKRRSQFRIKSKNLHRLYKNSELVKV